MKFDNIDIILLYTEPRFVWRWLKIVPVIFIHDDLEIFLEHIKRLNGKEKTHLKLLILIDKKINNYQEVLDKINANKPFDDNPDIFFLDGTEIQIVIEYAYNLPLFMGSKKQWEFSKMVAKDSLFYPKMNNYDNTS